MRTLNGLRRFLGKRGALRYIKDYHQSRINPEGAWDDEMHRLWSYGGDEKKIIAHANFMNECGSDLWKYKNA